ncbi:MAG: flagellar hook-basal body protein [Acidobacteria bacterium]|nr:flagellar hook-basal body protein [Acidobacteriota bacterium]
MDPAYYVAAGSLKARSFQMEVVANNLANSATVGYKPDRAFFAVFNKAGGSSRRLPLSGPLNDGVVFGETGVITDQGTLRPTARSLDFALQGEGFFMVRTPQGPRATRDGRFQMGVNGQLQAMDGSPLLGKNGQPIAVDPKGGDVSVTPDGGISQAGAALGALDIKAYENAGAMPRVGNLRFDPTGAKEVPTKATVHGGVLEQSSVDMPSAMVEMIRLNRLFEMSMKVASTLSNDLDARSINDIARS